MMKLRVVSSWRGVFISMSIAALALVMACGSNDPDPTATATQRAASQPTATSTSVPPISTPESSVQFPLTIIDAVGNVHVFDKPVTKVGCIWAGCSEMLADFEVRQHAGIGEQEQTAFRYPEGVPVVTLAENSAEEWAKSGVEVIFTRGPKSDSLAALEPVAPVFYLHHSAYFESDQVGIGAYMENLRLFGQLLGMPEKAAAIQDRWDRVMAALQAIAPEGASEVQIAPLFSSTDGTYRVIVENTPLCTTLEIYKIGQCAGDIVGESTVSAEFFLSLNPDWILYGTSDPEAVGWEDRTDPVWGQLTAVQEGQVFNTSIRHYCCSMRGLEHVLLDYAHYVFDPNIPPAGPVDDFDPWKSPLLAITGD